MNATLDPVARARATARNLDGSWSSIGALALLAGVYAIVGTASLELASLHQSASPVWPPSGIALAAVILYGRRVWPAIFAGAFLVNLITLDHAPVAIGIAVGNTLEAVIGGRLVKRFARGARSFVTAASVLRFVFWAGLVAPVASATLGVESLVLGDLAARESFAPIWLTWWIGDVVGILLVTPLIVVWRDVRVRTRHDLLVLAETVAAVALTTFVAAVVFLGLLPPSLESLPIMFLCLPPLLWPVFRVGRPGTVASLASLAFVALIGTMRGDGPFAPYDLNTSLLLVQTFVGTVVVTNLVLAALVGERRRTSRALERSRARLASHLVALKRGEEAAQAQHRLELEVEARKRVDAEVAAAVETERLRLGYELHEGLGQELAGIGYLMATFQGVLRDAGVEQAREAMRLEGMISRSIERTRSLAKAFYPVEMETLGLVGSLEEMAHHATRTLPVQCHVRDVDAPAFELHGPMAIQLFRIAEEAIQYEVEYGAARRIDISVSVDGERLVLTVAGDGAGVTRDLDSVDGAGVRRMRYRAEVIGGKLDVRSGSAGGTTVRCSAPVPAVSMA